MNNVVNTVPYLRTSREFPEEIPELLTEITKSYIDIAACVNNRTIGIFPANRPAITGNSYFFTTQKQQSLRQIYPMTSTSSIPHGLNLSQIPYFSTSFGEYTDGTNWYGLVAGSNMAIGGQISFYVDPTNIVFMVGAGAPTLTKGVVTLEWISNT